MEAWGLATNLEVGHGPTLSRIFKILGPAVLVLDSFGAALVFVLCIVSQVRSGVQATFFDDGGRALLVPDKRNMRRNTVQINRYRQSILRYGNCQGARGCQGIGSRLAFVAWLASLSLSSFSFHCLRKCRSSCVHASMLIQILLVGTFGVPGPSGSKYNE